jgi:hypothetical protein
MTQEQILQLTSAKHIKIYKLSQLNLTRKEIATLLGTNSGHVGNVLKDYANKPEKAAKANAL